MDLDNRARLGTRLGQLAGPTIPNGLAEDQVDEKLESGLDNMELEVVTG